jgi:hypothetical protein
MSLLWWHPSSGVYWLRKGVREELRKLVGRRSEPAVHDPEKWKPVFEKIMLKQKGNVRA